MPRQALDGQVYTHAKWMADGSSGGQDVAAATEHREVGRNRRWRRRSNSTGFTPPARTIAPEPANQVALAAATEHSILLHRDEARGLALEARAQYAPGDLHALARDALGRIASAGPESPRLYLEFQF